MGFEDAMEVLPGQHGDPYAIAEWIAGQNPRDDSDADEYFENPMYYWVDLKFELEQVHELRSQVAEFEEQVKSTSIELAEMDAKFEELNAEFAAQEAISQAAFDRVKADGDPEDNQKDMKVAQQALARLKAASGQMKEIAEKRGKLSGPKINLDQYSKWLAEEEEKARREIARFRAKGWVLPRFPKSLHYLLEEPKTEKRSVPPRVPHRRIGADD
jgi:hypothetical protein